MTSEVDRERNRLLQEIRAEAWDTRDYTGRAAFDSRVMDALHGVPRHEFVDEASVHQAYANHPLPIGHGQTISQPYIVALMTDLIRPEPGDVVLEIGTGSGYQAAVLSVLVKRIYSVEIIAALAHEAGARLRRLGYDNVEVHSGNGRLGWPQHAPYDAILVTAAASRIPPALVAQLKPGARLVIPLGHPHDAQELIVVEKREDGGASQTPVLPVAFVPLTGSDGD
ncbi:MAG: protein-L-isoaspartate(D-aspartate) O-methyltransferase [Betaproteobacteria bacterium]|nr:protein-L-isoaspartate(D-aspartate) O-methyltransferase [Betaproteobacteria bacterium]